VTTVDTIDEVKPVEKSLRALQAAEFIETPAEPTPAPAQTSIFDTTARSAGHASVGSKPAIDSAPKTR
jgi:hypothetical protein